VGQLVEARLKERKAVDRARSTLFRGNHSRIHHQQPTTQEAIMEIGIALGALVSVFVGLAALILWFPYDRYNK